MLRGAVEDAVVAPVAPVRMAMPPRTHDRVGRPLQPAASQVINFRIPWVGEFAARTVEKPMKLGNAVVHAGAQIEEAILGVVSGRVLQGAWVFFVRVDSGQAWVTHEEGSDLTKAGVRWLVVSLG